MRCSLSSATSTASRLAARSETSRPLLTDLETWLRGERRRLSPKSETAKAIDHSLKRWPALIGFLADGRACASPTTPPSGRRAASAVGGHNWRIADLLPWELAPP